MPIPSYILPSAPAYTEDSVYALIPTPSTPIYTPDAISFTRGSDATRTASNGLIQRAPWNLLQQSETFENASWSKSASSITANSITSPNGTITADTFTGDGTLSNHRISQSLSFMSEVTYTISCYVKKDTNSYFQIYFPAGQFTSAAYANYDLDTGTLGTVGSNATASIENVGNSWYRCVATATATSSAANSINFGLISSSTSARAESNSISTSVYIWGAQLVEGSQPLTYFPTTDRLNVPRIDFSQGSCPALLLEPQRTNLALYSDQFDSATWTKNASATITANSTTAPDGNTTADTLSVAASTFSGIYRAISGASANYTVSIYAKKDTKNWLYIVDIQGSTARAWFNLDSGVLGTVASGYSATITSVGNGWYRCTLTNTTALSALYYQFGLSDSDNSTTPTSSGSAFIYGAQIEVGSYATTYIPTTTTSVTRLADSFSKSNIFTNGLITAAGGTWYVELRGNLSLVRDGGVNFGLGIGDSAGTNAINIWNVGVATATRLQIRKNIASGGSATIYTTTADTVKLAIKWNGTSIDVFENGTKVVSASAFTITNMDFLRCSCEDRPRFIQAMALYPTPLSDAALITMTT